MINHKFTLLSSFACTVLQLMPTTVTAMDNLTLQVPINIPNMHGEVHQLKVSCQVLKGAQLLGKGKDVSGHGGLGTHQVINAVREVQIEFNSPLQSCQSYTYQCGFTFRHYQAGNNVYVAPLAKGTRDDVWRTNKPGARFSPKVKGEFSTPCPINVPLLQMEGQGESVSLKR